MKLSYVFVISFGYSLLLPPDWNSAVYPSLNQLKEAKSRLFTLLSGLIMNTTIEIPKTSEKLYFIPKELMNPTNLQSVGLPNILKSDLLVNLSNSDHLLIPKEFKTFFLFNNTESSYDLFKYNSGKTDLNNFLVNSIPFDIPDVVQLTDYFMVILSSNLKNASIYQNFFVELPGHQVPLFRKQLSESKPMVVFMFNQTKEMLKSKPILNIKNYLKPLTSIPAFFDKFANIWLNQVNYDSLVHAVYCNLHYKQTSYCVKLNNSFVDIFPAFKKQSVDDEVESQAIRQIHDKLVDKKTDTINFKKSLYYEPKETIERIDEAFDSKVDDGLTKMADTKEKLKWKLDDKKSSLMSVVEKKLDIIDDKSDAIADKITRTKEKISALNFDPRLFDRSKLNSLNEEYEDKYAQFDKYDQLHYDNLNIDEKEDYEKLGKYNNEGSYVNKRDETSNQGYYSFPISSLRFDSANSPRKPTYSQIINLEQNNKMKRAIQFSDDADCKPITWYNLFHYSIFGEPKFCKEQK